MMNFFMPNSMEEYAIHGNVKFHTENITVKLYIFIISKHRLYITFPN